MPITADEYGLREHWLCTKCEAGLARPEEPDDLPSPRVDGGKENQREIEREREGGKETRKGETIYLSRDGNTLIPFAGPNTPYFGINFGRTGSTVSCSRFLG